ncbi:uncharacterized protein EAE97_004150 [Botrytis byssoidea]|uniref:Uncharacterized protein n=1 Tax=Botrytis byssoidea TaxID=139641 RepID=A0A9P5ISE1_9HELO|nr:uncharacterized protein EAE97_004150 [Botrytis byssoidea]KAF7946901.1 hypothetical protein EAE97_004150 [Botrytis byssoidea]
MNLYHRVESSPTLSQEEITAAIMCRAANVARYYCDNRAGNHRHQPNQYWDACDKHPNPALRNLRYLETLQEPPCSGTLNSPLLEDSHITHLLALVFAVSKDCPLATGAPNARENIFDNVERYSQYLNERPRLDQKYTGYGNHPRHPIRPDSLDPQKADVVGYASDLQNLEGIWIPEDINLERRRAPIRIDVMNRLVYQLFRAKIDYQEAWVCTHRRLPAEL